MKFAITNLLCLLCIHSLDASEIFLGGGAKAGEVTDRTAIVHVRLTSASGQDAEGLIPGGEGQARVRYSTNENLSDSLTTSWESAKETEDHSIQFSLRELLPSHRYYYVVEMRATEKEKAYASPPHSFVTAPTAEQRSPVMFHLTTCQDLHGESTYRPMAAQRPDFCISAGDTVYYDGQGLARNVPQAWQAYQKMFGLPAMKDYYRHVGGYFMKDDHDYRFNDADPYMKGKWVKEKTQDPGARLTETKGDQKLDVGWLTHEEGIQVFKQVFPMGEKTYRTVRWGKGVQVWMLENRDFRSPNDMPDGPDKSIWGKEQREWLMKTLLESDADHRIIVSPNPIIGPDRLMKGDNHANLNGFWHEAQLFLDWLKERNLNNVVLMCGDRHWQYHSIDRRNGRSIHEFSCGPTSDDHVQKVPPMYEGVERPYAASRGGFVSVRYQPNDLSLTVAFHSMKGELLDSSVIPGADSGDVASKPIELTVDPGQKKWFEKYKSQENIPALAEMLLNTDKEPNLSLGFASLFNGKDLSGWTARGGKSTFEAKDGILIGTCLPDSPSTYLSTDKADFRDFIFSCEMKWEVDMNSGVMFRAQSKPGKEGEIVFGPQAEMEGTDKERGWSGGIYGQSCGGYFYPLWLTQHKAARDAIKPDGWNRLTIQAQGNVVKTWVNGIPAAHWVDKGTYPKGFFGLQVHKAKQGQVLFKNIQVKSLD